jgi:hypothetical protein
MSHHAASPGRRLSSARPTRARRRILPRFLRSMGRLDLRDIQIDLDDAQIAEDLNHGRD